MYKAKIYFETTEDSYEHGELIDGAGTEWTDTLLDATKDGLKAQIAAASYCAWEDINQEDINEYPDKSEYWGGYLTTEGNDGPATDAQKELWKAGKFRLWAVSLHILVSEVTERKAVL